MMNKNVLKKTRKKLNILHTIVIAIVIILLNLFIYQYFYNLTYKNVDRGLESQYNKIAMGVSIGNLRDDKNINLRMMTKGNLVYISKDNKLIVQYPMVNLESIRPFDLTKGLGEGISTYEYEGTNFRQLKENVNGYTVEVIKVVDIEVMLLEQLRLVLVVSSLIAIIVVYFISRYLTNKSLIPIEETWKNQSLFVQDASHELRTPLTIIYSKVENVVNSPKSSVEDEMTNLLIVMKEVRRLRKIVSDLLKLTKEEAIVTITKSDFDLVYMIEDISKEYEEICEIQGKTLKIHCEEKSINIFSDKEKLKQAIIILLDNAMKYTREDDDIEIYISENNNDIKIRVCDTGIGIKDEELPFIFNRFYRASSSRENNKEGSGIGLSIAKMLIENLDGKIDVVSRYSEGSKFSIIVPRVNKK